MPSPASLSEQQAAPQGNPAQGAPQGNPFNGNPTQDAQPNNGGPDVYDADFTDVDNN
jgi:hypothetical protein